jgi:hypothetical protein
VRTPDERIPAPSPTPSHWESAQKAREKLLCLTSDDRHHRLCSRCASEELKDEYPRSVLFDARWWFGQGALFCRVRGDDRRDCGRDESRTSSTARGFSAVSAVDTRDSRDSLVKDHPLRTIRTMIDKILEELSPEFNKMYSKAGRTWQNSPIIVPCYSN